MSIIVLERKKKLIIKHSRKHMAVISKMVRGSWLAPSHSRTARAGLALAYKPTTRVSMLLVVFLLFSILLTE
jgi:uncharacterized membrane protein YadS